MPVTVGSNQLSVVHKSSHPGASVLAFPDVCKTPTPGGPVPIPYPNLVGPGQPNTTGSKAPPTQQHTALIGGSSFSRSVGDEAGSAMGTVTHKLMRGQQLRGQLQMLHLQIANLPSGNPTRWHKLLDDYVILTAELYKTLSE